MPDFTVCSLCGGRYTESAPEKPVSAYGEHRDLHACVAELKRLIDQLKANLEDEIALHEESEHGISRHPA